MMHVTYNISYFLKYFRNVCIGRIIVTKTPMQNVWFDTIQNIVGWTNWVNRLLNDILKENLIEKNDDRSMPFMHRIKF